MYTVKTRNWNGNRWGEVALNAMAKMTGVSYWPETDHDTKYYLETKSALRAWIVWAFFMILRSMSGGWTYIVRPGVNLGEGYKTIY